MFPSFPRLCCHTVSFGLVMYSYGFCCVCQNYLAAVFLYFSMTSKTWRLAQMDDCVSLFRVLYENGAGGAPHLIEKTCALI